MKNEDYVKDLLLANSRYWILSKQVVKEVGIESAFFLTNLAEAEKMLADDQGWFYQTIDTVEELTTLSRYKQDSCIKELEKLGWLEVQTRGIPAKRYFRLNYDNIAESLLNTKASKIVRNSQTSMQETNKLDCKKLATNKEHTNKELNNKESIKHTHTNQNEYEAFFEDVWKLYPSKKGKGRIKKSTKEKLYNLGDEFIRSIERYIKYVEHRRNTDFPTLSYMNGSTFFNSGYVDYLDENYVDTLPKDNKPLDLVEKEDEEVIKVF